MFRVRATLHGLYDRPGADAGAVAAGGGGRLSVDLHQVGVVHVRPERPVHCFQVSAEAIRGEQTLSELESKYSVHQTMIAQWKRQAIEGMAATFSSKQTMEAAASPADVEKLHAKIGQLLMERDFLQDAFVRSGVLRGDK